MRVQPLMTLLDERVEMDAPNLQHATLPHRRRWRRRRRRRRCTLTRRDHIGGDRVGKEVHQERLACAHIAVDEKATWRWRRRRRWRGQLIRRCCRGRQGVGRYGGALGAAVACAARRLCAVEWPP